MGQLRDFIVLTVLEQAGLAAVDPSGRRNHLIRWRLDNPMPCSRKGPATRIQVVFSAVHTTPKAVGGTMSPAPKPCAADRTGRGAVSRSGPVGDLTL